MDAFEQWWASRVSANDAYLLPVRDGWNAGVAAERERCAQVASQEGPCCLHQGCHEAIAAAIREGNGQSSLAQHFEAMTDEQRREAFEQLFAVYCRHCGRKDSGCQCWNDE